MLRNLAAHVFELAPNGTVVYCGADARDHAADQRRIHPILRPHLLAGHLRETSLNQSRLRLVERLGRNNLGACESKALIDLRFESLANLRKNRDATVIDEHKKKITNQACDAKSVRELRNKRPLLRAAHGPRI